MFQSQTSEMTSMAMDYINKRNIPQLFNALMTGLLVNKPEDHIDFLIKSLEKYKTNKQTLTWDSFIERKNVLHDTMAPKTNSQLKSNSIRQSKGEPKATTQDRPSSSKSGLDNSDILKGKPIIFVVSEPGSGKGPLCERIVQRYGYTHLSTGDLLRATVQSKTEQGEQLNASIKEGKLVATEVVLDLLKKNMLKNADKSKGFLIDGYPREIAQAKKFEESIAPCNLVLYINAKNTTMTKRLLRRAQTSGRVDNNEETITKCLKTFQKHTVPVLDFYDKQNKLEEVLSIDSELEPNEAFNEIRKILDKLV
ncbi:unnamed protein product [Rotaria sp. Silwood1]|nr:unnamed protein product [Rotaria sp. Silwood1]CAF1659765.1 unnamed protein product [Rotaria sp. Silwood1]